MNIRRALSSLVALLATALLVGCAGPRSVSNDVSSFGEWPAGRAPGSYAFDRLPSQQAQAEETARLEAAAVPALARAGFQPVADGQQPDVLVQVGARSQRFDRSPWADPIWWRGSAFGGWRYGPWSGPYWGGSVWATPMYMDITRFQQEVALLIRDSASGKPLFEARASNESTSWPDAALTAAMFEAALMDFPRVGVNPRRVVVQLAP
jgi:Domain of unknown function (DUF4136)